MNQRKMRKFRGVEFSRKHSDIGGNDMVNFLNDNKRQLIFSFCMVLVVHMMKIVNYYPNADDIVGIKMGILGGRLLGRWFSGIALSVLSSPYDLPWVGGVVSAIFISLTMVVFLNIVRIESKLYRFIAIFLFIDFPSMASAFTYFWCPAFMLALFLAIFSVYLCIFSTRKISVAVSTLCFILSLGIYQIYYLVALITFLYYIGNELLANKFILSNVKRQSIRFFISYIGGAGGYWFINNLLMRVFNYEMTSYQGISEIGIMSIEEYIFSIKKMVNQIYIFWSGGSKYITIYGTINIIVIIFVLYCLSIILFNKNNCLCKRIILCLLFPLAVPITYCYYLLSPNVFYHSIMELGNYFVYLFVILVIDKYKISKYLHYIIPSILIILCYYHFLNDNIAYQQMNMSYEKTKFAVTKTLLQIDQLEIENTNKIAIIGRIPPDDYENEIRAIPLITGASTNNFVASQYHFNRFSNYFFGRKHFGYGDTELNEISEKREVQLMPSYPKDGYVKVVDGIIVIKLSE